MTTMFRKRRVLVGAVVQFRGFNVGNEKKKKKIRKYHLVEGG